MQLHSNVRTHGIGRHTSRAIGSKYPASLTRIALVRAGTKFPELVRLSDKDMALRKKLLEYKKTVHTEEGLITIQALKPKWVQPTADVLTEAFADAKGYTQYSEFLRRKIRLYLLEHMELVPQAVVLVATLTPHPLTSDPTSDQQQQQQQQGVAEEPKQDQSLNPFLTPSSPSSHTDERSDRQRSNSSSETSTASSEEKPSPPLTSETLPSPGQSSTGLPSLSTSFPNTSSSSSSSNGSSSSSNGSSSSTNPPYNNTDTKDPTNTSKPAVQSSSTSETSSANSTAATTNAHSAPTAPQDSSPTQTANASDTPISSTTSESQEADASLSVSDSTRTGKAKFSSTEVNFNMIWAAAAAIMDRGAAGDDSSINIDTILQSTGTALFSYDVDAVFPSNIRDSTKDVPEVTRSSSVYRWSMDDAPFDIPYTGESGPKASEYSSSGGSGADLKVPAGPPAPTILGSAEVSFASVTRSSYVTLNPPEDCGYICNMAVMPQQRGKGIGMLLMGAVEDVAAIVGKQQLFLHLRFQDAPATALYSKAGFSIKGEDWAAVTLIGWDRRKLMTKMLPPPPPEASQ